MGIIINRDMFEIIGIQGLLEQGFLAETAKTVQRYFPKEREEVFFQVNFSISARKSGQGMEFITLKGISVRSVTLDDCEQEAVRESLATYAHEAWAGWMRYLFEKCENESNGDPSHLPTGEMIIPQWAVERWQRQMNTPYADLPEEEKKSDRAEADKILAIVKGESAPPPTASPNDLVWRIESERNKT